jgi:hypothetical protein
MAVSSSSPSDSIAVDTTPQAHDSAIVSPHIDTPNTRKRQRIEYQNLHKYGFQGPPLASPKPDPPTKKARVPALAKASRATYIPEDNEVEEDDLNEDEDILLKDKKQNASGKRA